MYPDGATPQGIHDLAGNVFEWMADRPGSYSEAAARNPKSFEKGSGREIRGGRSSMELRVSDLNWNEAVARLDYVGFRGVRDIPSP